MLPWSELASACATCQKCSLSNPRNTPLGEGCTTADVMVVDNHPPTHGGSHAILEMRKNTLLVADLDHRHNVYLTYLCKCTPPNNRPPLATEYATCLHYLRNQVAIMRPKIIICLGQEVASRLIGEWVTLETQHGTWVEKSGVHMVALYHPIELLESAQKRGETYDVLTEIKQTIATLSPKTYF